MRSSTGPNPNGNPRPGEAAWGQHPGMPVLAPHRRRGALLRSGSGSDLLELLPAHGRDGDQRPLRAGADRCPGRQASGRRRAGPRASAGGAALRHPAHSAALPDRDQHAIRGGVRSALPAPCPDVASPGRLPPVARDGIQRRQDRLARSGPRLAAGPRRPAGLHQPRLRPAPPPARRIPGAGPPARSARGLEKGPGRPIADERARARVVAGLAAVDRVVLFDAPTPQALIEALRPEVLVKGGDYSPETIVGADLVEAAGGRVVTIPLVAGYSTSALVERCRAAS